MSYVSNLFQILTFLIALQRYDVTGHVTTMRLTFSADVCTHSIRWLARYMLSSCVRLSQAGTVRKLLNAGPRKQRHMARDSCTTLLLARLHIVGGQTSNGPAGGFTRAGLAMTSCRFQSNYSSTAARRASRVTYR